MWLAYRETHSGLLGGGRGEGSVLGCMPWWYRTRASLALILQGKLADVKWEPEAECRQSKGGCCSLVSERKVCRWAHVGLQGLGVGVSSSMFVSFRDPEYNAGQQV